MKMSIVGVISVICSLAVISCTHSARKPADAAAVACPAGQVFYVDRCFEPNYENLFAILRSILIDGHQRHTSGQIYDKTQELVTAGLNPDQVLSCKMPLLHFTILHLQRPEGGNYSPIFSSPEAAVALIRNSTNVNVRDMAGRTPLHVAVFRGDVATAQALLEKGADINAPWCPPGAKKGSFAYTAYDLAKRARPFDYYKSANSKENAELLRDATPVAGASAKDLNLTCPAVPELTDKQRDLAKCKDVLREFELDRVARP